MLDTKAKKLKKRWVSFNLIVFILITLGINYLFYYSGSSSFYHHYSYNADELLCPQDISETNEKEKEVEFQEILTKLESEIENSEIKLFKNFVWFDVFVENDLKIIDKDGSTINTWITQFNINMNETYIEVHFEEKKKLFSNLKFDRLKKIKPDDFVFKINFKNISSEPVEISDLSISDNIKFYIELSKWSFFVFLFISIPATLGVLLLFNAIYKFIFFGKPFTDKK